MPNLVRRQLFLDSAGIVHELVPESPPRAVRVLALPARLEVAGRTWTELLRLVRELPNTHPIHFPIADYLPRYVQKLTNDLETALTEGRCVYLWTIEGKLRVAGYPLPEAPRWTDTDRWYRTAADALVQVNGIAMEEIP